MRFIFPLSVSSIIFAAACSSPSSGSSGNGALGSSGQGGGAVGSGGDNSSGTTAGSGGSTTFGGSTASGGSSNPTPPGSDASLGASGGSTGGSPAPCDTFFADCNGNPADGCETNTSTDPNNCGKCGTVCPGAPNASPTCFVGKCGVSCNAGWGDCNTDAADGCEANLATDVNNCGACGMACQTGGCVDRSCECASTSTVAKKVPLDMYILFDQSGSMGDNVTGGTKWNVIKGALTTFLQNSASAGIGVGIGYFPLISQSPDAGGGGGFCIPFLTCGGGGGRGGAVSCNWQDYSTPDVGITLLPGAATPLVASLNAHGPGGNTPTYPALQGAYSYATSWATAHPDRKTIVVLATDGDPTSCGNLPNNVNGIATNLVAPALAQMPSLLTFVVGVGSSLTSLNQIAASGGTGQALIVDTAGADPGGQFLAAMQKIEGSVALGCEYGIPTPPSGPTDFGKVNVKFTPPSGSPTILRKVNDAAGCDATSGGWYYDVNGAPTKIILCDSSCTVIQSIANANVEVELGCATVG